jgi:hypothetical protein
MFFSKGVISFQICWKKFKNLIIRKSPGHNVLSVLSKNKNVCHWKGCKKEIV